MVISISIQLLLLFWSRSGQSGIGRNIPGGNFFWKEEEEEGFAKRNQIKCELTEVDVGIGTTVVLIVFVIDLTPRRQGSCLSPLR